MQHLHNHQPIELSLSLKQVLVEEWKIPSDQLPISGGWGYVMEDSIIIHKENHARMHGALSDTIGIEYLIVEKRINAELITLRSKDDIYCDVCRKLIKQETIQSGSRWYDHLRIHFI